MTSVSQSVGSDHDSAARAGHSHELGERLCGVRQMLEHALGAAAVELVVGEIEPARVGDPILEGEPASLGPALCLRDHRLAAVDPDDASTGADELGEPARVVAWSAAEVEDRVAFLDVLSVIAELLELLHGPADAVEVVDEGLRVVGFVDPAELELGEVLRHRSSFRRLASRLTASVRNPRSRSPIVVT